ncbi:hypothetical protein GcC1_067032 [Golovinomyces cichoracearum]|uniref:GAG-pre-integrase domain-containing protein n=1 Tax=Golovinomyces cichoracearum TaxID=62708 RepID=A0A420IR37_9PEZI|nr:hypothetical protein GcC1_067032 [Golovinomyces cichoracearum]
MSQSEDEILEQKIINKIDALTMEIDYNLSSDLLNPEFLHNFICPVPAKNAKLHIRNLADNSFAHLLTCSIPQSENSVISGRYSSNIFHGIMLDTGAATISTAGHEQAKAYCRLIFHIIEAETPFLLCLKDMDRLNIYFNNLIDAIITPNGSQYPIVRKFDHPFLIWGRESMNYLSESELRQLHRRFGHPSVNRLVRTLERAGHSDPKHRPILNYINKFCEFCQKNSRPPLVDLDLH